MATTAYYLKGTCKWAMVHSPDRDFDNFKINLYMDDASKKLFADSGMTLEPKKEGKVTKADPKPKAVKCELKDADAYITFRRPNTKEIKKQVVEFGKPQVLDADGNPTKDLIGNGSEVTIKVIAFDTQAHGKGHRLEAVQINELVPYEGKGVESELPEGMDEAPF
jgi:hypothetical protein